MGAGAGPSVVAADRVAVGLVAAGAAEDGVHEPQVPLTMSPCVRIRLPTPDSTGRDALTPEQVGRLCAAHRNYEVYAWTLAFTGARADEMLRRNRTDWHPQVPVGDGETHCRIGIRLPPRAERRRQQGPRRTVGKSRNAIRWITLCPGHGELLDAYLAGHGMPWMFVGPRGAG